MELGFNNIRDINIDDYNIYSTEKLKSLMDEKGYIHGDIVIRGDEITSLGALKKVYGNLGIDSSSLENLGELNYVQKDFWLSSICVLSSLGNLERVGGDVSLRYSKIIDLGKLWKVGKKLSLRDTQVENIASLKEVKVLFLPKRLSEINLDFIKYQSVKYWSDQNTSTISNLNKNEDWGPTQNKSFAEIHTAEIKNKKRKLTGKFLVKKCFTPSQLNPYITENIEAFFQFVDVQLDHLYGGQYSFFLSIFNLTGTVQNLNDQLPKLNILRSQKHDFSIQRDMANKAINLEKNSTPIKTYLEILQKFKKEYNFSGSANSYWLRYDEHKLSFAESTGKGKSKFVYFIENTILQVLSIYVLSLQDDFRVARGIPKIGQGWVSETQLYLSIKQYLSKHEVIQHGKPKWLGRQHVDVWVPSLRLGIEFHGNQHFEPINFFGGHEAFVKNQERDKRKKELFVQNGCILIEVTHGYSFDELKKTLDKYK